MKIHLDWARPIPLKDGARQNFIYTTDLDKLPSKGGVYIFGRRYGRGFEALYVGKATNLRRRVKGQLNNLRLMQHLKSAKAGKRILLAGQLKPRPGQQSDKCLTLAERALIRHFLSENHDLVNRQGVRLRRHAISSSGRHPKRFFPAEISLERSKGE